MVIPFFCSCYTAMHAPQNLGPAPRRSRASRLPGALAQPLAIPLQCESGDCALLRGAPQTAGMRSGFVRLKPGQSVGWHSTGRNEESSSYSGAKARPCSTATPRAASPRRTSCTSPLPPATTSRTPASRSSNTSTWWRRQRRSRALPAAYSSRFSGADSGSSPSARRTASASSRIGRRSRGSRCAGASRRPVR